MSSAIFQSEVIRNLLKPDVTIKDLQLTRKKIQSLADETNTLLKKNVYKNYALFIDTSKEILSLKNEMYTLSNLLNDQQKILNDLSEISISGDKAHGLTAIEKKEVAAIFRNQEPNFNYTLPKSQSVQSSFTNNNSIKNLQDVLDMVEGVNGILDSRNRVLLMYGELIELDSNEYKPIPNQGAVFSILLNDCLLLSTSISFYSRFSNKKYKFQSIFELNNIAVINVKDLNLKNAFKILMSTQTKVFVVDSEEIKSKWLEAFEQAKKQRKATLNLQRRDSLLFISNHNLNLSLSGNMQNSNKTSMSPIDRNYSLNSFEESELLDEVAESDSEMIPDWLADVPEDLDVLIAQRNFEEAVVLINKVNDHFAIYPKCCDNIMQTDLKLRINNKIKELIDSISNELQITPDRSMQSGPKSARKAVQLLIRLGKSSTATKLFLQQRAALLNFCLKQQKKDGATIQFIKRMSLVFFNNMTETCKEFQRAFDVNQLSCGMNNINTTNDTISINNNGSLSLSPALGSLVVWIKKHLTNFLKSLSKNVFNSQVPEAVVAECFYLVRNQCKKLAQTSGLNLTFLIDYELKNNLQKFILEYKEKILEGIRLRSMEEKWKPQNHQNKAGINKFIEEMKSCNLGCVANYVFEECRVNLTQNTTSFSKAYLSGICDLLKLHTEFTHNIINEVIRETFITQMKYCETSIKSDKFINERKFIRKNVAFLIETVLVLAEQFYLQKMNEPSEEIVRLKQDYQYLKNESNVTVIEKGSKTKVMIDFL